MIRKSISGLGERLVRSGDAFIAEADAERVEYGNPKEVPQRSLLDSIGERSKKLGDKLIEIANRDDK